MASLRTLELVARFQRCRNYPKDDAEIERMADTLERAARTYEVTAEAIVRECLSSSEFCPTDADLLSMARGIRGPEPAPDIHKTNCPFDLCDGSGWIVEMRRVNLVGMEPYWTSGARRCKCHPARESDPELVAKSKPKAPRPSYEQGGL